MWRARVRVSTFKLASRHDFRLICCADSAGLMFVCACSHGEPFRWKCRAAARAVRGCQWCLFDSREWSRGRLPAYQVRVQNCSETLGIWVTKEWIRPWWIILCHPQLLPTHLSLIISFCWGGLVFFWTVKKKNTPWGLSTCISCASISTLCNL